MSDETSRIAEYKRQFERANGKPIEASIIYERGWFVFLGGGMGRRSYRSRDFLAMTESLRQRAYNKDTTHAG